MTHRRNWLAIALLAVAAIIAAALASILWSGPEQRSGAEPATTQAADTTEAADSAQTAATERMAGTENEAVTVEAGGTAGADGAAGVTTDAAGTAAAANTVEANHTAETADAGKMAAAAGTADAVEVAAAALVAGAADSDAPAGGELAFDVLRVEENGTAVFAGRGTHSAPIKVLLNGEPAASAEAGADGTWSVVTELALKPGEYLATLRETLASGETRESENPVLLLVPERVGDTVAVAVDSEDVRVLQAPTSAHDLTIDSISYGAGGHVRVSGRGSSGDEIALTVREMGVERRVVADLQSTPGEGGRWVGVIEQLLPAGETYVLHARTGDAEAEIQFRPESPAHVFREGAVVVQPGNSLWRIARRVYGRGIRYHLIYRENSGQIDHPDLIFPGQVFTLPPPPN